VGRSEVHNSIKRLHPHVISDAKGECGDWGGSRACPYRRSAHQDTRGEAIWKIKAHMPFLGGGPMEYKAITPHFFGATRGKKGVKLRKGGAKLRQSTHCRRGSCGKKRNSYPSSRKYGGALRSAKKKQVSSKKPGHQERSRDRRVGGSGKKLSVFFGGLSIQKGSDEKGVSPPTPKGKLRLFKPLNEVKDSGGGGKR